MRHTESETRTSLSSNEEASLWLEANRERLLLYINGKLGTEETDSALDIWQEISLVVHGHSFSSDPIHNPHAWLRRIASNKIADHWRSFHRTREANQKWAEAQPFDFETSPSDWVLDQSRRAMVRDVLEQMKEADRHLLREKYLLGRTVAEMAIRENRSEKVIEHGLAKARASFRKLLLRDSI